MVLNLAPRRPSSRWMRELRRWRGRRNFRPEAWCAPPTIAHLQRYGHASVLLSGPLSEHLGLVFTGNYSRATRPLDRANPTELDSGLASAFTHLVYTPSPRRRGAVGVLVPARVYAGRSPADLSRAPNAWSATTSMSLQSTWEAARQRRSTLLARVRGGVGARSRPERRAADRPLDRAAERTATVGAA